MRMISLKAIKIAAIAILMTAAAGFAVPVMADSGSHFNAPDGRVNPLTGDRVMVYLKGDKGIAVWGMDTTNNGQPLTTFTVAELVLGTAVTHATAAGNVTVTLLAPSKMHVGYLYYGAAYPTLIVDQFATYQVSWSGGWGADGSAPYVKVFCNCWGI